MEYGLIGYPLTHSFSKNIHNRLSDYDYDIFEIEEDDVESFIKNKNFKAINVTIPYKNKIIPFLDFVDDDAKEIAAVNTVVNDNGVLYGYNTDILGVSATFDEFDFDIENKNVLILGTGATSNTVKYTALKYGAKKVYKAYRKTSKNVGDILYEDLKNIADEIDIIINTTSNGMYPHIDDELLIDLRLFKKVKIVFDVVYNPLRTRLLIEAEKLGIKAVSGLYMLVAQAVYANNYFFSELKIDSLIITSSYRLNECFKKENILMNDDIYGHIFTLYDIDAVIKCVYEELLIDKLNIVLTGMPSSGKSGLGKRLADRLIYDFIDTDELIEEKLNIKISDYILKYGEEKFRNIETEIITSLLNVNKTVISTGGGAILREENVEMLKSNGKLFFINRSLEKLQATDDRPLTPTRDKLAEKYYQRLPIYKATCDVEIDGNLEFDEKIDIILKDLKV